MNYKPVVPVTSLMLFLLMLLTVGPWIGGSSEAATSLQAAAATAAPRTVLVELFTSEGCSSCPPADKLLTLFEQIPPVEGVQVITLSEHVDYWNRLGWKDPFSSAEFSQRQSDYAQALKLKDFYTPQMIVDGQTAFVGSKVDTAIAAITSASRLTKATVSLSIKATTPKEVRLGVQVENAPDVSSGDTAEVMLAIAENDLQSDVSKGENSGRKLAHSAVTRKLMRIGTLKGKTFSAEPAVDLKSNWKPQNMKAVAFVQERGSRRVLGVAAIKLAGE